MKHPVAPDPVMKSTPFEEDFGNDETKFTQHGSKTIKNLNDAKQAAINFAKYIS